MQAYWLDRRRAETSVGPTNNVNPSSSKQQRVVRIHSAESTRVPGQWSSDQGKSILIEGLTCPSRKGNGFIFPYHADVMATEAARLTRPDKLCNAPALLNLRSLGSSVKLRTRRIKEEAVNSDGYS